MRTLDNHKIASACKVDYTIPPPITADFQLEHEYRQATPTTVRSRRGRTGAPKTSLEKSCIQQLVLLVEVM